MSTLVGIVIALFFFWKRLREDYTSEQIFSLAFYIVSFSAIGAGIFGFLFSSRLGSTTFFDPHGLWFWGMVIGMVLGLGVGIKKFEVSFFEAFEALGLAFLISFGCSVVLTFPILSGICLLFVVIFFVIDRHYKKLAWYRSGRVGFAGCSVMSLFFLVRSGIALVSPHMVSFIGKIDSLISISLSFIVFFLVYYLASNKK